MYTNEKDDWVLPTWDGQYASIGLLYTGKYLPVNSFCCPTTQPGNNGDGSIVRPNGGWRTNYLYFGLGGNNNPEYTFSYGNNIQVCGVVPTGPLNSHTDKPIIKAKEYKYPGKTVMWGESLMDGYWYFMLNAFWVENTENDRAAFRHRRTANLLMLGGNIVNVRDTDDAGRRNVQYVWASTDALNK